MFCRPSQRMFFVWVAAVAPAVAVAAAEINPAAGASPFRIRQWTTDQGLPQNRISCLKQARDGYLWIGTWFGLVRFDGVRFTVFNKFNTPELENESINGLAEDASGTLWIGTGNGLVSYQSHRFRRLTTADGLPGGRVWRLANARGGGFWLHSGFFVVRFDGGAFTPVWKLPHNDIMLSLQEDAAGWLNIARDRRWLTLSPGTHDLRTNYLAEATTASWQAALPAREGGLWVGTTNGLYHLHQGVMKAVETDELAARAVDFIYQDRSGHLWVNAGGLFRRDDTRWQAVDLGEGFTTGSTICMEEDLEGSLWVGTDRGLVQLQPRRVRAYTADEGLPDDNAWSVCEGTDGALWVGTDRGLGCIREGRVVRVESAEPQATVRLRCVWPNRRGGVWIVRQDLSLLEFQNGVFSVRVKSRALPGLPTALYEDRSGRLWVGTDGGLLAFEAARLTTGSTNATAYPLRYVHSILEDREGVFWFGTKGQGVARMRDGAVSTFTERDGLSNNHVWAIQEDAEGALWLGTENGLTLCRDGRFFAFTTQQGLQENTVNWILEDDFGYLWLSGLRGIYRVKRAELNAVAAGRAPAVQCFAIGTADGMESAETNGENQPAGWKTRDGRLWFPTIRGVVVIDPKTIAINETPPPVVIERIKADDTVVFGDPAQANDAKPSAGVPNPPSLQPAASASAVGRPGDGRSVLRIPPGRAHVLEFQYTANSFAAPARVRFRYRLIGADRGWREETSERAVRYINLRPGNYRFEVIAANHHGVWNWNPAVVAFSLAPHFWQTWSFYALCATAVIALAAAVQAYRLRWQRRLLKLEEQRALANERTRIARDLHDDLGTALTGLALELDVIGREPGDDPPLAERLGETARRTRDLAERMREVVWTVNPRCDTVSSLASFLEHQVSQFLRVAGIRVRLEFPEDIPPLPLAGDARHQLALSVREALTNVVRHAQATEVAVSLALTDRRLVVRVKDNGRGFTPVETSGHGLANLRARLNQIGGSFECISAPGAGTELHFRVPLKETPSPKERIE